MFFLTGVLFVYMTYIYINHARGSLNTLLRNYYSYPVNVTLSDDLNFQQNIFYQHAHLPFDSQEKLSDSSVSDSEPDITTQNDDYYYDKIQQQVNSYTQKTPFTFYVNHTIVKQKPKLE